MKKIIGVSLIVIALGMTLLLISTTFIHPFYVWVFNYLHPMSVGMAALNISGYVILIALIGSIGVILKES